MSWPMVPLGEVAKISAGNSAPQGQDDFSDEGTPFVRAGSLSKLLKGATSDLEKVGTCNAKRLKLRLFPKNSILFAKSGMSCMKGYVYRLPFSAHVVSHLAVIQPGPNLCASYCEHAIRFFSPISLIKDEAYPSIRLPEIAAHEIPLPPLEEQKRIAGILDQANELRRLRALALDKLNTLGQAVFHEMFGEIGTSLLPTQNFGDFAEIKLGKMLDRGKFKGGETKPYLRNVNIRWFYIDTSDVFEMEFGKKEQERFRVHRGDLLICEGGEPGRCAIWTDENVEIYYQKALHRVRLNQQVALPDYVAFWFFVAAATGKLSDFISSATIAHLTGAKIKLLPIMLPDIADQRVFSSRLEKIKENRVILLNQLSAQEALLASLQHRAFRGDL